MNEILDKLTKTLKTVETKYIKLKEDLSNPDNSSNIELLTKITKAISKIEPIFNLYQKVKEKIKNLNEANELLASKDLDFVEEAKKEIDFLTPQIFEISQQLQIMLLPKDQNDNKNVIVEIRGAAGGDEANIFAGDLFRMYSRYFDNLKKYKIDIISTNPSPSGGYSYISFSIKGPKAYSLMKWESGSHRVQRIPATESKGRVHTSTATVLVMPEATEVDVVINVSDLRIDTFRSSGAGGQHVNTTDSAIRITHIPTGIVSQSQDGRSQHKNKEIAMTLLKTKIYDAKLREEQEKRGEEAKSKIGSGDRSEKIRTYNYPQNRLTDHRINLSLSTLDRVMEGNIEPIIKALLAEEQRIKIMKSQL